jgi:hypothetical protein
MAESLREFLDRRERELLSELLPTEATVAAIRAELAEIRRARNGVGGIPMPPSAALLGSGPLDAIAPLTGIPFPDLSSPLLAKSDERPTIKELVVNALATNQEFRRYGATAAELKECLKHMFDRDVEMSSLSPQLSRLRDDGVLTLENGKWKRRTHGVSQAPAPSPKI